MDQEGSNDIIKLIQRNKLFSSLSEDECRLLQYQMIELMPNEILLRQGDYSEYLYVVIEGRLLAKLTTKSSKQKIIGTIEEGESVGELGAISGKVRTMTVIALSECKLLKISHNHFKDFCLQHPIILQEMMNRLIGRMQSNIGLLSEYRPARHISIMPANEYTPWDLFTNKLKDYIAAYDNIIVFDDREDDERNKIINKISSFKTPNVISLYLIHQGGSVLAQVCREYTDRIFLVAMQNDQVKFSDIAIEFLISHFFAHVKRDLILLHSGDKIKNTTRWVKNQPLNLYHNVRLDKSEDFERVFRCIIGNAIGLVLGGGGAKTWAEIGVIKALIENKITVDAIGGSSAGAFVAACYALTQDYDKSCDKMKIIIDSLYPPFALRNFTWPIISLLSGANGTNALQKVFSNARIEDLILPFYCMSSDLSNKKSTIHKRGFIWEKLRASVAVPGIFPPYVHKGQLHVDGGLMNNVPVNIMRELIGDTSKIIAVNLNTNQLDSTVYNFPPIISFKDSLLYKIGLGNKDYKFPNYFDTFMQALILGASAKEKENSLLADILITPDLRKFHMFSIDMKIAEELIEIGYQATMIQIREWQKKP